MDSMTCAWGMREAPCIIISIDSKACLDTFHACFQAIMHTPPHIPPQYPLDAVATRKPDPASFGQGSLCWLYLWDFKFVSLQKGFSKRVRER